MQQLIVTFAVVVAVLFSAWKLMPARRRLQSLIALNTLLADRHWLQSWRQRVLLRRIQIAAGSGCAGCAASGSSRSPRHAR